MPDLVLKETGEVVTVAPANLGRALASGLYEAPADGETTTLATPEGLVNVAIPDAASYQLSSGTASATPEQVGGLERQAYLQDEHGGALAAIGTGIEQGLNEATFGAYGAVAGAVAGEGYQENMEGRAELHDVAAGIGGGAGMILPALASGGESLGAKILAKSGSGLSSSLGARIAAAGAERGVVGRAIATAAGGSVEGALLSSGHVMAEAVLHDTELTGEAFVAGMEEGATWGGLGGAGASLLSSGARGVVRKVDEFVSRDAELAAAAKRAKEAEKAVKQAEKELAWEKKEAIRQSHRIDLAQKRGEVRKEVLEKAGEVRKSEAMTKAEARVVVAKQEMEKTSEALALARERTLKAKLQADAKVKTAEIYTSGNLEINRSKELQRGISKEAAEVAADARIRTGLADARVRATDAAAGEFVESMAPASMRGVSDELASQVDEMTARYRPSGAIDVRDVVPSRALTTSADAARRAEAATAIAGHVRQTDDILRQVDELIAVNPAEAERLLPMRDAAAEASKTAADVGQRVASGIDSSADDLAAIHRAEQAQHDIAQGLKMSLDEAGVPSPNLDDVLAPMDAAVAKTDDIVADGVTKSVEAAKGEAVASGGASLVDKVAFADTLLHAAGLPDAEDIPVVGPLLGTYLRLRAFAGGGRMAVRFPGAVGRIAQTAARTQNRASEVVGAVVKHAPAAARVVERAAPSLTSTLSRPLWEPAGEEGGKRAAPIKGDPLRLFRQRAEELERAVGNPDGTRQKIIESIPAPPSVANAIADQELRKLTYLHSLLPVDPRPMTIRSAEPKANMVEVRRFCEGKYACENPVDAIRDVLEGLASPRAADAVKAVFPRLFQSMQEELIEKLAEATEPVPFARLVRAAAVFNIPIDHQTSPEYGAARMEEYAQVEQSQQQPTPSGGPQLRLSNQEAFGTNRRAMR